MKTSMIWASAACAFALGVVGCGSDSEGSAATAGGGTTATTSTSSSQGGAGQGGAGQGGGAQGGAGQGGAAQGGAGQGGGGAAQGGPFSSNAGSSYETQTTLAADGKGGLVAAWVAFFADGTSAIGYAVSRDGGDHWTTSKTIASPDGRFASNPSVVADSQGRVSLAWLGFTTDTLAPDEHVYVSRLDPATETFGPPVIASDDGSAKTRDFDKPALKVDANDNLLVTWADFTGSSGGAQPSITFARSADGQSFDRKTVVADATFGNLASLCLDTSLGPTAPIYLVHLREGAKIMLRVSTDQGATWTPHETPAANVVFQDVSCVAQGKAITIVYATGQAGFTPSQDSPASAIEIARSTDGGETFAAPTTVVTAAGDEKILFPSFVRAPAGKHAIVHYHGVVGGEAKLVLQSSTDGAAWTASPIAPAGTMTIDRTIASWLGATIGLAAVGGDAFTTYADNSENKAHVRFATIALP